MTFSVVSRVSGLAALTAAGQLLIICTLPAYSNIFDPGSYGEYVIFLGTYIVISVLAGAAYDSAIVLPRNDGIAATLAALVMLIALAVSTVIGLATMMSSFLSWTPGRLVPIEGQFGYGLAAATTLGALQRCLSGWCIRGHRFLLMGWGQLVFCAATIVSQLSLARIMHHSTALIWGYICALAIQTVWLAAPALDAMPAAWAPAHPFRAMKVIARKYRRFPVYMVGHGLASSARDRLIQVVLGIGAGAAAVGRFGLAYRVMFAPNSLVYNAVAPVFYAIASRGDRLPVGRFAANVVEAAFVMLLVPYVAFAVEAPALTEALLSEKWHGTGLYLQALAGPALLLATTSWLDRAFDSFRKQKVAFSLEVSFTFISIILIACLSKAISPLSVTRVFALLALVYYWTYFLAAFLACGFSMREFRRANRNAFLALCIVSACAALIQFATRLDVRLALYTVAMAVVIGIWHRYLDGAAIISALMRFRLGSRGTQEPMEPPRGTINPP